MIISENNKDSSLSGANENCLYNICIGYFFRITQVVQMPRHICKVPYDFLDRVHFDDEYREIFFGIKNIVKKKGMDYLLDDIYNLEEEPEILNELLDEDDIGIEFEERKAIIEEDEDVWRDYERPWDEEQMERDKYRGMKLNIRNDTDILEFRREYFKTLLRDQLLESIDKAEKEYERTQLVLKGVLDDDLTTDITGTLHQHGMSTSELTELLGRRVVIQGSSEHEESRGDEGMHLIEDFYTPKDEHIRKETPETPTEESPIYVLADDEEITDLIIEERGQMIGDIHRSVIQLKQLFLTVNKLIISQQESIDIMTRHIDDANTRTYFGLNNILIADALDRGEITAGEVLQQDVEALFKRSHNLRQFLRNLRIMLEE